MALTQVNLGMVDTAAAGGLGMRNKIINGAMEIDQRNAGASVTYGSSTTLYAVDRWGGFEDTDGEMTGQQSSEAPAGFINSIKLTTTTADSSLGATQRVIFRQIIEGSNCRDLNWGTSDAKTITISFWVRSSLTGTHGGVIANQAQNRSYPFTYTISAADTWEQKSITVAGDTSGTWLTTNAQGIRLIFGMGVGSTYSGTAGSWAGTRYESATGAVSVIGTLNATWYITGVQLEVGSVATEFERRPYTTELSLCQRYCLKYCGNSVYEDVNTQTIIGYNATSAYGAIFTVVPMRTTPSISHSGLKLTDETNQHPITSINASGSGYSGPYNLNCGFNVSSGLTIYRGYQLRANNNINAYLILSAEL